MSADLDNAQGAGATEIVSARRHGFRVTDRNDGIVVDKVTKAADSSQVTAATNPVETGTISRDGTTVIATVNYKVAHDKLTDATRNTLQEAAQQGRDGGLTVEIGGDALHESASDKAVAVSIAIDALVLLITSGSLAAASTCGQRGRRRGTASDQGRPFSAWRPRHRSALMPTMCLTCSTTLWRPREDRARRRSVSPPSVTANPADHRQEMSGPSLGDDTA